jgi:hypothetical protein
LIQTDLEASDVRAIVVDVDGLSVTVHYTDVHRSRVRFFQDLLQPYRVGLSATMAPGINHHIVVGRYAAKTADELQEYLTFLGSRLVFLVDWDRARKLLAQLVGRSEAVALTKWAADNDIGHRGFLQAGGIGLIDRAIGRALTLPVSSGVYLSERLGQDIACSLLMSVMRTTTTALTENRSGAFIADEIEAELLRHVQRANRHLLERAGDYAAMMSALGERIRCALASFNQGASTDHGGCRKASSIRAERSALKPTRVLTRVRQHDHQRLLAKAGSAAEALEETAHLVTLLTDTADAQTRAVLTNLGDLACDAIRAYARCIDDARDLTPSSPFAHIGRFIFDVDHLGELMRQAGLAQRSIAERLLRSTTSFHDLYVVSNMARGFERVTALLARCGVIIRDRILDGANIVADRDARVLSRSAVR